MKKYFLTLFLLVASLSGGLVTVARAQNTVSGDIAGTVQDATGAVISNAEITVTNVATGAKSVAKSNDSGLYRVSLLEPGSYRVVIAEHGFTTVATNVTVSAGLVANGDVKLQVGNAATTVEVTEAAPLLHTENAEISTEFSQEQIASLPNPGNDLTFVAQTTPGAVMNTMGGYGNFSSFGLPATANTFTINGGYEDDPFLNVSNSGASNLLLGNNDIGTVTVLSNAYDAQFGGLGGTQVNEISRSGGNRFHGDVTYQWNGSVLNANDYFNNQTGTRKPRSNANQWSGAIGGPIVRDKTFFFFNTEGLRVIIPVRGTVYAPSKAFMDTIIANAGASYPGNVSFFQNLFTAYTSNAAFNTAAADSHDPNLVIFNATSANFAHEAQYTGRIDQRFGTKDNLFVHGTVDKGVQPTFTSLLEPIFNTDSPQPEYEGQLNETHIFTPNLANQFVFAEIYYQAVFQNTTANAANSVAPFSIAFLDGDLASNGLPETPGGADFNFPQGRKVNGYQFIDDLTYSRGKHNIKTGFYMRRDDITDLSPQVFGIPLVLAHEADFASGNASLLDQENFPTRPTQPVSVYNMGIYLQDQWKVTPQLSLTIGMRFEHNSNPVCHTNCFARLANDFASTSTSPTAPYDNTSGNGLISSGLYSGFSDFQKVGYEPRFGFSYAPLILHSKTVIRGGFGIFADSFPAQIADGLLNNAPGNVGYSFVPGPASLNPADPTSFQSILTASTAQFRAAYASGGNLNSIENGNPGFTPPSFISPVNHISYPTYEEYNFALEQQLGANTTIGLDYVGNRTYHQPVVNNSVNAYNAGGALGFPSLPATAPNPNFSGVSQVYSGAISNYNGLVFTATKRSTYLTLQFNYTYSHALDEISNGGFNSFSGNSESPTNPSLSLLRQNYGNADYDTRNYVSMNYVFTLPYFGGPKMLTGGWQIAGTLFHSSGLPFTFTDNGTAGDFGNYGGSLFAQQTVQHIPTKCSGSNIENLNSDSGIPCAASLDVTTATNFGQQERNQVFGPNYTDTDMSVYKSFSLPKHEGAHLKLGVQFFNLLNHPNFGQPDHNVGDGNSGLISTTVNPPTSILGSFLGGDASPRLIQLKANINF